VHHGLLVAAEVIRKVLIVLKRRSYSRYIAVAKNPEAAREKLALELVPLDLLIFRELDRSLRRRHSTGGYQINSSKGVRSPP
jgi:hypothetical protein